MVGSRIHKIRAFSRQARTLCAVFFAIGLVATVAWLLAVALMGVPPSQRLAGTPFDVLSRVLLPWQARLWWVLGQNAVMAVGLVIVFQLYRLFGSLAGGAIYTLGNVQRVRYVGLLLLLSAALNAALPALTLALAATLTQGQVGVQITLDAMRQTIGSFAAGGLILLASWIMDVGLYAKEHADELQRESDLMI